MNRSELNTVFFPAISLWINTAENNTYALQPEEYCVMGYDGNNDLVITDWIYTSVTEPTINDLLAYTLTQVNNYWDRVSIIPQIINNNSNIYALSNSLTKNDIPTSLLNNGSIILDGTDVFILINGSWNQVSIL